MFPPWSTSAASTLMMPPTSTVAPAPLRRVVGQGALGGAVHPRVLREEHGATHLRLELVGVLGPAELGVAVPRPDEPAPGQLRGEGGHFGQLFGLLPRGEGDELPRGRRGVEGDPLARVPGLRARGEPGRHGRRGGGVGDRVRRGEESEVSHGPGAYTVNLIGSFKRRSDSALRMAACATSSVNPSSGTVTQRVTLSSLVL